MSRPPAPSAERALADPVDAIVLGMGPGGEEVATRLAEAGMTVVGIDAGLLGGECPYWGCIPSKMMVRASDLLAEAGRVPGMAGEATVRRSWQPVARRVADATDSWDDAVAVDRFRSKGGHFFRGWGTIEGPKQVRVGDRVLHARSALVVATGSSPVIPPIDGLSGVPYWTNREAVECESVPSSLVVLGGGAVGVELGQVFARFGSAVTMVEAGDRLLGREEPESSDTVKEALSADGVAICTGVGASRVSAGRRSRAPGCVAGVVVELEDGRPVEGEALLVAVGRAADLQAIGAGALGVDASAGGLPVDGRLRVSEGVWAVGDVTGEGNFTHLAIYQARIAADDILGNEPVDASYHALPRVTFTDPEIGAVGLTEAEARRAGLAVTVSTTPLPSSARGWIHGPGNAGFVKLVVDSARDVLVGATSAGPSGGEMLGLLTLAVHAAVPIANLRRMIYAYPTFHRAVEDALAGLPR